MLAAHVAEGLFPDRNTEVQKMKCGENMLS